MFVYRLAWISAQERTIKTQLDDFEAPSIMTYSLESTIAEKLDAILQRFELTGRMKDFYDIYYLSQTFDFDGEKLSAAIKGTLRNRNTEYNADSFQRIKALVSDENMQTRWRHFLGTLNDPDIPFAEVMDGISAFIEPVWTAFVGDEEFLKYWYADERMWR